MEDDIPGLQLIGARDLHSLANDTVASQRLNHSRKFLLQVTQELLLTYGKRREQLLDANGSSNLCINSITQLNDETIAGIHDLQ